MLGIFNNESKEAEISEKSIVKSPYFDINPSYLGDTENYILLEDASPVRSRVQVMFSAVGTATICGAALGGVDSLRFTGLKLLGSKGERMQMTSAVLKNGGRIASKFGSMALLYYACSIICEKSRDIDDELNTVIGGGAAGALYSLPAVMNVKADAAGENVKKLGYVRRLFIRLPPVGRILVSTGIGFVAGGLMSFYKSQTADYVRKITTRD